MDSIPDKNKDGLPTSISDNGPYADLLRRIDSSNSILKLARSISVGSTYADLLKRIDSSNSISSKLARSISVGSTYADLLKRIDNSISKQTWTKSVTDSGAFYASLERLSQYEHLDSLFEEIDIEASGPSFSINDSIADLEAQDAVNLLQELASTEDPSALANILVKAPGWLKWLLVSFIVAVIWPLLLGAASGVMGNLITPYVQAYLDEVQSTTQREQIKGLKKLSLSELGIELRGYRFITAATLHIRATPNARAPIVGELKFGQVVSVLSYNLDWSEVLYEYGDGSTVIGWVFTRYTAKFRS